VSPPSFLGYPPGGFERRELLLAAAEDATVVHCDETAASGEYSWAMQDGTPPEHLLSLEERRRLERVAVDEAGGGESEGFELAEQELIEHASHGDEHTPSRIIRDAGPQEEPDSAVYGEADEEQLPD